MSLATEIDPQRSGGTSAGDRPAATSSKQEERTGTLERRFMVGVFLLVTVVGSVLWITDGAVLKYSSEFLDTYEPDPEDMRNAVTNCQHPKNQNTPYCQDRAAATEATWRSIVRGNNNVAFRLNQVKKKGESAISTKERGR